MPFSDIGSQALRNLQYYLVFENLRKSFALLLFQADESNLIQPMDEELVCDYCQTSNKKNQFGQQEDLLVCKDCSNKGKHFFKCGWYD